MSAMTPPEKGKVTGLVAATFTPLTEQGEINISEIEPYVEYLIKEQGVNNIFVNGTTGEGLSLSVAERKTLAEEWSKQAKSKNVQMILHVGCMSLKDSQELALHAAQIGVDGIAVMAPFLFKPRNANSLRKFLQEVASVAPTVPFYYYHIPSVTSVNVPVRDLLQGIENHIPSFRGVKFSATDLMDFGLCANYIPSQWTLLYGVDEQLLAGLAMGAQGAVGSTYNYVGCHFNKLIAEFDKGNLAEARAIQIKLQELIKYAKAFDVDIGVFKQLMVQLSSLRLGPPRLPLLPCPEASAVAIAQKYHELFCSS